MTVLRCTSLYSGPDGIITAGQEIELDEARAEEMLRDWPSNFERVAEKAALASTVGTEAAGPVGDATPAQEDGMAAMLAGVKAEEAAVASDRAVEPASAPVADVADIPAEQAAQAPVMSEATPATAGEVMGTADGVTLTKTKTGPGKKKAP